LLIDSFSHSLAIKNSKTQSADVPQSHNNLQMNLPKSSDLQCLLKCESVIRKDPTSKTFLSLQTPATFSLFLRCFNIITSREFPLQNLQRKGYGYPKQFCFRKRILKIKWTNGNLSLSLARLSAMQTLQYFLIPAP